MKKFINKYLFVALAAGMFASCSDEDNSTWAPGEPDDASKAGAYFASQASSFEVAPGEATSFDVTISRLNTSSAASVPLKVSVNQDDVFTVPATAEFAAGAETATFKVDFSKAQVGTTYNLTIDVPAEYVATYKAVDGSLSYSAQATIVKWNLIDKGRYYTWFFEDFYTNVELYQRDDDKTKFKMTNWGATEDMVYPFTMDKNGNITGQQKFYIGYDHPSYGEVWASEATGSSYWKNDIFYFAIKYHVAAGSFGTAYDYFVSDSWVAPKDPEEEDPSEDSDEDSGEDSDEESGEDSDEDSGEDSDEDSAE